MNGPNGLILCFLIVSGNLKRYFKLPDLFTAMTQDDFHNKVDYKFFDKSFRGLTSIYSKFKYTDSKKLAEIEANLQIVTKELNATAVYIPKQVHGRDVVIVTGNTDFNRVIESDGIVTSVPGIALAIQTADCVPVLLASGTGSVIGAVHCGWRGAKAGIIKEAVKQMRLSGSDQILAVIGPSIQQYSYEVSEDFHRDFLEENKNRARYFIPSVKENHYMFDLPAFVMDELTEQNVKVIKHINEDTYSLSDKYPSYRRSLHVGEKYERSLLSAIIIRNR